jgi:hypothetical protein
MIWRRAIWYWFAQGPALRLTALLLKVTLK